MVSTVVKHFMTGLPLTPLRRIGGTIFKAATDSKPILNGSVYTLLGERKVSELIPPDLKLDKGVYKLIDDRTEALRR